MAGEIPIFDRVLDKIHGFDSKSVAALTGLEKPHVRELIWQRMWPVLEIERQRKIAQAAEILLISHDATEMEKLVQDRGYEQPSAFVWLTSGFKPPEGAEELGEYGKGIFKNFLMTDVAGHSGKIYISKIGEKSVVWFQGRAHPNEWEGERWANIFIAHQYEVIKEDIRRRRMKGENPVLITTYLAGAVNGSEFEMEDLAIVGADMDFNAVLGAGKGARSVFDRDDPFRRFQSPMFRSTTPELAQVAMRIAKEQGIQNDVGLSAVMGTPGPTEFQEVVGVSLGEMILEHLNDTGKFEMLKKMLKIEGVKTGCSFDMGITLEMALWRLLYSGEAELNRLGFVLHSDDVSVEKSASTSHRGNIDVASKTLSRNMAFLTGFLQELFNNPIITIENAKDYSWINKLSSLPKEKRSKLIDWIVARYNKLDS